MSIVIDYSYGNRLARMLVILFAYKSIEFCPKKKLMHTIFFQEQYIEDDLEWEFVHVQTNQLLIEAFQAVSERCCANTGLNRCKYGLWCSPIF